MNEGLQTVSLRENPELLERFCGYFSLRWGKEELYRDCMQSALQTSSPLPQWFLLLKGDEIAGGCGLITNDFISRMDLYPWLCAVYVEGKFRRQVVAAHLLIMLSMRRWVCCTDHTGVAKNMIFNILV